MLQSLLLIHPDGHCVLPILDETKIPQCPKVIAELRRLLNSPDSSAKSISDWISLDSALSAKLLRMANSSYFGGRGKVASIPRAITLIGFEFLQSIILANEATKAASTAGVDASAFWKKSLSIAGLSRWIARRGMMDVNYEEAFTAGLLSTIGMLLIPPGEPAGDAEVRRLSAEILRHWRFPDEITDAVHGGHDAPSPCGKALDLAECFLTDFAATWERPFPTGIDAARLRTHEEEGLAALLLAETLSSE